MHIGLVAVGANVDVAIVQGGDILLDVQRLHRLQHHAGSLHGAFLMDGLGQTAESRAAQVGSGNVVLQQARREADIAPQRFDVLDVVGGAFAFERDALHASIVVGQDLAAIGDLAQVKFGRVARLGLFQNDFVKTAGAVVDGQGALRGLRCGTPQSHTVVVAATGIADIDSPLGEIADQQGVVDLAQGDVHDLHARQTGLAAQHVDHGSAALAKRHRGRGGHARQVHRVVAFAVAGAVVAKVVQVGVGVVACTAFEDVVVQAAIKAVVAGIAFQLVLAFATQQGVVARATGQPVVALAAVHAHTAKHRGCGGQRVLAVVAAQDATGETGQQFVIAHAAASVHRDGSQAGGVKHVLALAHVGHDLGHARVGLVPVVKFNVDGAAAAREDEGLVAVGGVEVLAQACTVARIDVQRAAHLRGEVRLNLGRVVFDVEQVEAEQVHLEQGDRGDPQVQIHEEAGHKIGTNADVEQVGKAPAVVLVHGLDFGAANLAVRFPDDLGHIPCVVFFKRGGVDVLQVQFGVEIDAGNQAAGDGAQVQACHQANEGIDIELGLVDAASAGDDLAVAEGGQGHVVHEEAIEHIEPVACGHGLAHAIGVVTEGQVGIGLEACHRTEHEVEGCWHQGNLGGERLLHLEAQQGQFVAEEHGIAATENLLPVADVKDVLFEFEAAALGCFRSAAQGHLGNVGQCAREFRGQAQASGLADDAVHQLVARKGLGIFVFFQHTHVDREVVQVFWRHRAQLGQVQAGGVQAGGREAARSKATKAAQHDLAGVLEGTDLLRQIRHELHGLEEGCRDLGLAHDLQEGVEQAQRRGLHTQGRDKLHP